MATPADSAASVLESIGRLQDATAGTPYEPLVDSLVGALGAAIKRKPVVRLRFCAHPFCHRLVKGVKGTFCIYHETNRG